MNVSTVPSKPVLPGQVEADPSPHFYHEPGNQNSFLNQGELITLYSNVQLPTKNETSETTIRSINCLFPYIQYIHVKLLLSYSRQ